MIRRILLPAILSAVSWLLALAPVQAQPDTRPVLGINMLFDGGDADKIEASFEKIKALGMTEARVDWEWRAVEPTKGTYDWTVMDRLMDLAEKHSVHVLPIVHYAPEWALVDEKKKDGIYELAVASEHYAAYADFLAASILRYGPKGARANPVRAWQVWNEPNMAEFWGPKPDATAFAGLMRNVQIKLAGLPGRDKIKIVHAGISRPDLTYLWHLWDVDPQYHDTFDIMAVHAYFMNPKGGVRQPDALDDDSAEHAAMGFVGSIDDTNFLSKVFNVQLFMTLKGAAKPIWITETGFLAGDTGYWHIPEDEQASLTQATLDYIAQHLGQKSFEKGARGELAANVEKVYWFTLQDYNLPSGEFGVYRADGSVRPVADVLRNAAQGEVKP